MSPKQVGPEAPGSIPDVRLHDGNTIPQLGFGTLFIPAGDTVEIVTQALLAGVRHVDTSPDYDNEAEVGQAIHASGVPRAEVFVTTKLENHEHGHEQARRACRQSLDRLELDFIDLYLIHWPVPSEGKYVESWRTLVELQGDGLVRSIGVSNFEAHHLRDIVDATAVTPVVNQIELHPYLQQAGLRREHADRGIVTEAWSPLAQGKVLGDPVIRGIADAHGVSSAQVVIRWHIQLGNVLFPRSATPARIASNLDVFGFHLTEAEMADLEGLDAGDRTGPDPDTFVRP